MNATPSPLPPAYVPAPGTLGPRRAQWALRTAEKALERPDGLPPYTRAALRRLRTAIKRYAGGTRYNDAQWNWLCWTAAELGLPPFDPNAPHPHAGGPEA